MKRKVHSPALAVLLAAATLVGTAVAQQKEPVGPANPPPAAAGADDADTIKFDSALVNTYVTVRDANGRLVSGLTSNDFTVLDNGKEQPITYFGQESSQPLRVVLVIDRSRSVQRELARAKTAAQDFFTSVLRPGRDRAAVVAFDSGVYLLQGFTDNTAVLTSAVSGLTSSGGTSIFDAVYKTARDMLPNGQNARRVIILVTDGDDTTSQASITEAIEMASKNNVIIYAVRVPGEGSLNVHDLRGRPVLDRLTQATGGGQAYFDGNQNQLAAFFARVRDELRSEYSIGYQFTDSIASPTFHKLTINVKSNSGPLRAFTRKGYYSGGQ
jgi:Ca-activated chloride channel family protein